MPTYIQSATLTSGIRTHRLKPLSPEEESFYSRLRNLLAKLPDGDDPLTLVLRAHLVVEQLIIQTSLELVENPDVLAKATRLNFSTRLIFLRALMRPLERSHANVGFWQSLELLNSLRNDLAHKLDTPAVESDIQAFIDAVDGWLYLRRDRKFRGLSKGGQLREALRATCEGFSGILAVVRDNASRRRRTAARKKAKSRQGLT